MARKIVAVTGSFLFFCVAPGTVAGLEDLIVSGLYRYLRNPMYVAVLLLIGGQGLLLGSAVLLQYAGAVWLLFHAFVLTYEERALRRRFGAS